MKINFNLNDIRSVEFGIGREIQKERQFYRIAVNSNVQENLNDMAVSTRERMELITNYPKQYEPSEKYERKEHIFISLENKLVTFLKKLHNAQHFDVDQNALDKTEEIFCYYAKFRDGNNKVLTAVKRSNQFKGVLKKKLLHFLDDTFNIVEKPVFVLNQNFDFLIDEKNIHILSPNGFELIGKLQEAILASTSDNIKKLEKNLDFVDFTKIKKYVGTHTRAARYLASIVSFQKVAPVDKNKLIAYCKEAKVDISIPKGKIIVANNNNIMGFLQILDRRILLSPIANRPEYFHSESREQVK